MKPSKINFLAAAFLCLLFFVVISACGQTNPPVPPDRQIPFPYRVEIVASDLQTPWSVVFTPDKRLIFTERPGRVGIVQNGVKLPEPALVLPDVAVGLKMGVLGMVLHPGFATNHWLYLAYDYTNAIGKPRLRIRRYEEAGNRLVNPFTMIDEIPAWQNHTGCRLRFGPDGCLYITTGDADNPPASQLLAELSGKILRLNPDGTVPKDNPFVNQTNARPEIWSYGHRNPQGIYFAKDSGLLFECEHGPDNGDEINLIYKGENYGWPVIHHRFTHEGMYAPLLEFTPSIAPSGLLVYQGDAFPELKGNLLVGCLRGEGILRVRMDGTNVLSCERWLHYQFGRTRDVVEGPDGYIYFTTSEYDSPDGTPRPDYDLILRLVPKDAPPTGLRLATTWHGVHREEAAFDPASTNALTLVAGYCASCHGPELKGGLQHALIYRQWNFAKNDDDIRHIIQNGIVQRGMPAFGRAMNQAQIEILLSYIRQHETNAPANLPAPLQEKPPAKNEFE